MNYNILITGAFGFVGSNISAYLAKNTDWTLIGLDIIKKKDSYYKVLYNWDELELINFDNIDTIIHLAGFSRESNSNSQYKIYFDINYGLTKLVFDKFHNSNAKRFIFFSSVKAVTDSTKNKILTEDDLPQPKTAYGKSKLEAEKYILSHTLTQDKRLYILRPAMIHGPGNKGNLASLYKFISTGYPYPLGAFSSKRSYTSIGNLNFIIEKLIEKDIASGIYQIADDEALSSNEILQLIFQSSGKPPIIWKIPTPIIKAIALLGNILPIPINSLIIRKFSEDYIVSNKKIVSAIESHLPIAATEGLKISFNDFKQPKTTNSL